MGTIIPYDDSLLDSGAFISPSGKIFRVKDDHEAFCEAFLSDLSKDFGNDIVKHQHLYKMLDAYYKNSPRKSLSDFMVLVLDFDKVEIRLKNTITTSSRQPHIRFYNYYLMDWNISVQNRVIYDYRIGEYRPLNYFFPTSEDLDREAEDEIKEIKAKVLVKDRHYFFKE